MGDVLSRGQLDGAPVTRWSGAAGEAAPLALSFEDFLGAFPVFLLRRRARTSGGTVQSLAMIALACCGVTGWPPVSQMT